MRLRVVARLVASAVAIAVVSVAASAASAQAPRRPGSELALVPLSRAEIGRSADSLPLDGGGIVTNAVSAGSSDGQETVQSLTRAGRVVGYSLFYGDSLTRSAPVSEVDSVVTEWRNADDARHGLTQEIHDNLALAGLSRFGIRYTVAKTRSDAVGSEHFAYTIAFFAVHCTDELVQDGRYTLGASVCGASSAATEKLDPILNRHLDQRLHLALAGQLRSKPVRPPSYAKPGPPARGPKPAALAVTPQVLPAKAGRGRYVRTDYRSQYDLSLRNAGPYAYLYQDIFLMPNHKYAMFEGASALWHDTHEGTYEAENKGRFTPIHPRSIDLSGVPDHPLGQIVRVGPYPDGTYWYDGHIVLRRGPWLIYIVADRNSPIPDSDLRKLAEIAAKRLDNGLHG
jgi:hypothetical protein